MKKQTRRRGLFIGLFVVVLIAGLVSYLLLRPESQVRRVLREIDEGHHEAAMVAISELRSLHPDRLGVVLFLEGYDAHARGRLERAARLYGEALGEPGGRAAGARIIYHQMVDALRSTNCGAQTEAARTLGELGDRSAVGPLRSALARQKDGGPPESPYCRFRSVAADALRRLGAGE